MTRDIYILPLLPRLLPSASVVFEEKGFLKLQTTHRFDHRVKRGYCFSLSPVEPQPESTARNYLGLMFFQNVFFNLHPTSLQQLACTQLTPASTILVSKRESAHHTRDTKERFATNDIDAGEEITFCYDPYSAHMTRSERHESLQHMGFACKCRA
jgi:hypothetical protein